MTRGHDEQAASCESYRRDCHKLLLSLAIAAILGLVGYTTGAYVFSYGNHRSNRADFMAKDAAISEQIVLVRLEATRADERAKVMQDNYAKLEVVISCLSDAVGKLEKAVIMLEARISPKTSLMRDVPDRAVADLVPQTK